jgi:hypothetical protein
MALDRNTFESIQRFKRHDRNAVLNAANGVPNPWNYAFWWYFGRTHQKAMAIWAERDRQTQQALERCAAMVAQRAEPERAGIQPLRYRSR